MNLRYNQHIYWLWSDRLLQPLLDREWFLEVGSSYCRKTTVFYLSVITGVSEEEEWRYIRGDRLEESYLRSYCWYHVSKGILCSPITAVLSEFGMSDYRLVLFSMDRDWHVELEDIALFQLQTSSRWNEGRDADSETERQIESDKKRGSNRRLWGR